MAKYLAEGYQVFCIILNSISELTSDSAVFASFFATFQTESLRLFVLLVFGCEISAAGSV